MELRSSRPARAAPRPEEASRSAPAGNTLSSELSPPTSNIQQGAGTRRLQHVSCVAYRKFTTARRPPASEAAREPRGGEAAAVSRATRCPGNLAALPKRHERGGVALPTAAAHRQDTQRQGRRPRVSATRPSSIARAARSPRVAGEQSRLPLRASVCGRPGACMTLCPNAWSPAVAGGSTDFQRGFRPFPLHPCYRATKNGPAQVCTFI
jgi:hypothetical protein